MEQKPNAGALALQTGSATSLYQRVVQGVMAATQAAVATSIQANEEQIMENAATVTF